MRVKENEMLGIKVKNLVKQYQEKQVLRNINFEIDKPGVYLIAGPNGSGKTTLLEILAGMRDKTSGEISIFGNNPGSFGAKRKIGFLCQQNSLRRTCYVKEELQLIKEIFGMADVNLKEYLKKLGLDEYYEFKTKKLSGGLKRRVLLGMTMLPMQEVIILDEPVSGLDTFSRNEIWNMIVEYAKEKIVIISDHYLNQAAQYCDYLYLLDEGKIIASGTVDQVKETIPESYVIKVHNNERRNLENAFFALNIGFELRVSGTVCNYYIKKDARDILNRREEFEYPIYKMDFEDVYFYYTSRYSHEGGYQSEG